MGKIYEVKIDSFDGGMSNDKRSKKFNQCSLIRHFDAFSYTHKLAPSGSSHIIDDKTKEIVKFLYALGPSSEYRIFGFGQTSNKGKIYYFADDDTWTALTNGESTGSRDTTAFFYYKGYIYFWRSTPDNLVQVDADDGTVINNAYQTISYDYVAQPVHHPNDDIAYFFSDNNVHTLNDTSFNDNALVLPTNQRIMSACAYGNYLAIGCTTLGTYDKKSVVYLWDRDSSLTTLTERIDFGAGELRLLANLDNNLIAVMDVGGKTVMKRANGLSSIILNEIDQDGASAVVNYECSQVINNRLFFAMDIDDTAEEKAGIWAVDSSGRIALEFAIDGVTTINGFFYDGSNWWIAHSDDGSLACGGASGTATTSTAIYESLIFGEPDKNKKLLSVGVSFQPLPAAGQVVLEYRANEETSWTTIFTHTTDDSIYHEAINIESSGATLPQFREIQFRIESTGLAAITGLHFKYEDISSNPS